MSSGKLYGLFIGVSRYDSEQIPNLRYAARDDMPPFFGKIIC